MSQISYPKPKYRSPRIRNPRAQKFPVFTSGLETRLTKTLGEDATSVISYLSRKVGKPTINKESSREVFKFTQQVRYAERVTSLYINDPGFDPMNPILTPQYSITFQVVLVVGTDGKLSQFDFKMGALKI